MVYSLQNTMDILWMLMMVDTSFPWGGGTLQLFQISSKNMPWLLHEKIDVLFQITEFFLKSCEA